MYLKYLSAASLLAVCVIDAAAQQAPPPAPVVKPKTEGRRARVVTRLEGFELMDTAKAEKLTTVAAASRGPEGPRPIGPRLAKLYSAEPTLTWTFDGPPETTFRVRVYNEDEVLVHEASVTGLAYRYGAHGPRLKPGGTYYWTAEMTGVAESRSELAGLKVAESDERTRISAQLEAVAGETEAAHLARARVFVEHRLWYDALAAYDAAVAASPKSPEAHERRAELLAQLPAFQPLADRGFAIADALRRDGR